MLNFICMLNFPFVCYLISTNLNKSGSSDQLIERSTGSWTELQLSLKWFSGYLASDAVTSWSSREPTHHSLDDGLCWFPIAAVMSAMRPKRRKRLIPPSGRMISRTWVTGPLGTSSSYQCVWWGRSCTVTNRWAKPLCDANINHSYWHTFWGGRRRRHFPDVQRFWMHWTSSSGLREQTSTWQESGKFPAGKQHWSEKERFFVYHTHSWTRPLKWSVSISTLWMVPGWPSRNTAHSLPVTCRIPCWSTCQTSIRVNSAIIF